ncbi:unnamed protein product [Calypogeia fissa]
MVYFGEASSAAEVVSSSSKGAKRIHNIVKATLIRGASLGDAMLLIFALYFHSVFEGIAIGVAWRVDLLNSQHQHLPRSEVGTRSRDARRRSTSYQRLHRVLCAKTPGALQLQRQLQQQHFSIATQDFRITFLNMMDICYVFLSIIKTIS